jgi:DNA repair exonuclease SbcCD ATPase subunit
MPVKQESRAMNETFVIFLVLIVMYSADASQLSAIQRALKKIEDKVESLQRALKDVEDKVGSVESIQEQADSREYRASSKLDEALRSLRNEIQKDLEYEIKRHEARTA